MRKYNLLFLFLFLSTGLYAQLTVSISKQDACNGLSNGSITILVTNADGPPVLNVIGIPGLIGQPLSVGVPFIFDDSGSGLPTGLYSLVVQDFVNPSFFQDVTIIDATPIVSFAGLAGPYCEDAVAIALTGSPLAPPGTGVWTTTAPGGLVDNGDGTATFDPALGTVGTWDITYTYTNTLGCTDFDTQSVTINALPVVSFAGLAGPYCEDAGVVALTGAPLVPAGTWSTTAPGGLTDNLDGTATLDPSLATPGTWDITYTYTNGLACTDFDTQSVTINPLPVVSFSGLAGPYCEDAGVVALTGSPLVPAGTWSTTAPGGLTDNLDGTASLDPSLATPGTWDITYTYTDGLGCSDFDTQSVTINALPVVSFAGLAGPYCEDAGVVTLTGAPLAPAGTWSTTAPGGLTDNSDGTASLNPSLATPGTWDITYTYTDGAGCSDFDTQSVTINPLPVVSFAGLASPYCEDAGVVALTGAPLVPAGTWSTTAPGGLTDNLNGTATFDPNLATPGTWDITYTYTDGLGCSDFDTQSVTINALPVVSFAGLASPYCENSGVVALTGSPLAPAGTWSTTAPGGLIDNLDGTASFNPALATAGIWDITYTYTDGNGCSNFDTQSVTINTIPVVSFVGLGGPYCEDAGVVALTGAPLVPAGTWSTTAPGGLTDNLDGTATLDPSLATPGTWNITYTYTNGFGCSDFDTQSVTINALPVVTFAGLASDYCADAGAVLLTGNQAPNGTFVGIGVTDNGNGTATLDPTAVPIGPVAITYSYTDGNGCTDNDNQITTINAVPVVTFVGLAGPYCENDPSVLLTGSEAPNGTFSGLGITDNGDGTGTFDPSIAGGGMHPIVYTFTDGNGCTDDDTQNVTVNALPAVSFVGLAASYCVDAAPVLLTGNQAPNGTFAGPGITDNGDGTANFDPAAATAGAHSVSYSFTDLNGCTGTDIQSVTVNALPVATFAGLAATYCENDVAVVLTGNQAPNGTFAGPGITDNGDGTAIFDPSVTGPGPQAVTYTFTDGNGCTDSDNQITTVNTVPIVSFVGLAGPYCENDPPVLLTGSEAPNGTFSGPGIIDNGDGTANFDPALATGGVHNIAYSYTDANSCTGQDIQAETVNSLPVVSFTGLNISHCIDETPVILTGSEAPNGTFSGPGVTDNGDGTASFDPTAAGLGGHAVLYSFTDGFGCVGAEVQPTTVVPLPTVSFSGLAATYCFDDAPATLTGSPVGPPGVWSTTAPGGLTDNGDGTSTFTPSLATGGSWDVTYTYTDGNGCVNFDTRSTLVHPQTVPTIAGALVVCLTSPTQNYSTDSGQAGYLWTVVGGSIDSGQGTDAITVTWTTTGSIAVDYTDVNSCLVSNSIVVNVFTSTPPPVVTSPLNICIGDPQPAIIIDNFSGQTVSWYADAGLFGLLSNSHPYTPTALELDTSVPGTTSFFVTQTVAGCGESAPAQIDVIVTIPPDAGTDATVNACDTETTINLFNQLGGTPDAGGTWTDDDGSGALVGVIFNPSVAGAGTFNFTYTTSTNGCPDATAIVTVIVEAQSDAGTDSSVGACVADTSFDLFLALGGTPDTGGTWTDDGASGALAGSIFDPSAAGIGTYNFTYSFTPLAPCTAVSATVTVTVGNVSPPPITDSPTDICIGDPVPLLNAIGTDLKWYSDAGLTTMVGTGNSYTPGTEFDPNVSGLTQYFVTQDVGCGVSFAATYDVNVLVASNSPLITPIPDLCLNDPIPQLVAVGTIVIWHSNAVATDTLAQGNVFVPDPSQLDTDVIGMTSFFATQDMGCGRSTTTETIVNVINCVGSCFTQNIVAGEASCLNNDGSISFNLDGSEVLPVTFKLFELSGTDTVFQQTQSGNFFDLLSTATYDYEIMDSQGCAETGQVNVPQRLSTLDVTISLATAISCIGELAVFDVVVVSGGSSPFEYSIDGGTNWLPLLGTQILLPAGDHDIFVRDDSTDPCPYDGGTITVDEPIGITYTIMEPTESFPERPSGTITITDVAGGVSGYEIQAELITPSSPYPGQSYLLPFTTIPFVTELGKFEIVLEDLFAGTYMIQIRDSNGCIEDVFFQGVDPEVPLDDDLFIPNVFTPNSDGTNDFFFIRNLPDDTDTRLTVTNRYGKQVYGSVSYKNDWDGEGLPDGVYYYAVVITVQGQEFDYNGWVEIWSGL